MRQSAAGCLSILCSLPLRSADDEGDADCWAFGFSRAICCDLENGPKGKEECWDEDYTFERCCRADADHRLVYRQMSKYQENGYNLHATGVAASGEAASEDGTGTPDRLATILPSGGVSIPVGDECWKSGFSWATCCGPDAGPRGVEACWDGVFTFERCCLMSVQASSQFFDALQSDAVAECLMGLGEPSQIAKVQPSECTEGRYFMLARVTGARAESYFNHRPWWERITEKQRRQEDRVAQEAIHPVVLTQPAHFSYQGSFCVSSRCL